VAGEDAASSREIDAVLDEFRRAQDALLNGDPEPAKALHSKTDDVSLSNPLEPPVRGWDAVEGAIERAAANFHGGGDMRHREVSRYVTSDLAYVVQVEDFQAKIAGQDEPRPGSLRATIVFRREGAGWMMIHRHADPLTSPRPAETLIHE
jgi:ketosteroid isomerase-like protein